MPGAGCGGEPQALYPARAGHDVAGIDTSGELLARLQDALSAEPAEVTGRSGSSAGPEKGRPSWVAGTFDLVLCHVAAMYLGDITPMLTALARVTAPGGAMSLLVRNGLTTAMRDGLRGDWAAALAAFDAKDCQVGANVRTMDKQFRHQARLHKAQTGGG